MSELISIIVPVYNVEKYIEKCVNSILNQTYENLEIILVDDGSTDASSGICDKYAQMDNRIIVIHKKNGGLSSARNAALDIAKGEYVGFVDSDDYIDSDMYMNMHDAAVKYNCGLVVCGHYVERDDKISIEIAPIDEVKIYDTNEALELLLDDENIKNYAWDKLYKRELFEAVRYPEGRNYEDIATTYMLFDKVDKICYIPHYSYYYQLRADSISQSITDEKWHKNCLAIIQSMVERNRYFIQTKDIGKPEEKTIVDKSFACIIPYVINYIKLGYELKNDYKRNESKQYLKDNIKQIESNAFVSKKDKILSKAYLQKDWLSIAFLKLSSLNLQKSSLADKLYTIKSIKAKQKTLDFDLKEGKQKRIFIFELPCFDNLGDHAIAYACLNFFNDFEKNNPEFQIIRIDGWDTNAAVYKLKKQIKPSDIIICQGGGNMGNLYMFAEGFRRKIFKAFRDNKIIVFPQTIFFTADESGKAELEKTKKCYNACKNLTIFARDAVSYEVMKSNFNCEIIKLVDSVAYLDNKSDSKREGIMLCLRSDKESSLSGNEKKKLLDLCRMKASVLISDTVTGQDIPYEEREAVLQKKWKLFSQQKLVVTDRLHGMIFSLINHTPCIVLGNNHHKVKETFKMFSDCNYLYYAESILDVEKLLQTIYDKDIECFKPDYRERFKVATQIISD